MKLSRFSHKYFKQIVRNLPSSFYPCVVFCFASCFMDFSRANIETFWILSFSFTRKTQETRERKIDVHLKFNLALLILPRKFTKSIFLFRSAQSQKRDYKLGLDVEGNQSLLDEKKRKNFNFSTQTLLIDFSALFLSAFYWLFLVLWLLLFKAFSCFFFIFRFYFIDSVNLNTYFRLVHLVSKMVQMCWREWRNEWFLSKRVCKVEKSFKRKSCDACYEFKKLKKNCFKSFQKLGFFETPSKLYEVLTFFGKHLKFFICFYL